MIAALYHRHALALGRQPPPDYIGWEKARQDSILLYQMSLSSAAYLKEGIDKEDESIMLR